MSTSCSHQHSIAANVATAIYKLKIAATIALAVCYFLTAAVAASALGVVNFLKPVCPNFFKSSLTAIRPDVMT